MCMPQTLEKEEAVPHWLLARGFSQFLSMQASPQGTLTTWQLDFLRESETEKAREQEGEGKCTPDRNQSCIQIHVTGVSLSRLLKLSEFVFFHL